MRERNRKLARKRLDDRFESFRSIDRFAPPRYGWIRAIRNALGMTGSQLAHRMGVTRQRVSQLERAEQLGSVPLNTLRKAAEAMDCALIYAIVPRRELRDTVNERARERAIRELDYVRQTMALEDQAVSDSDLEDKIADYIRQNIRDSDLWSDR